MEQAARDTLGVLLRQSKDELQGTVRVEPRLLSQLDALERVLEAGRVTRDMLEATATLLRGFVARRTVRGPAATLAPLRSTRELDDWIRNYLIRLDIDPAVRPGEASSPGREARVMPPSDSPSRDPTDKRP